MKRVTQKPLKVLPQNAFHAASVCYVKSYRKALSAPCVGVFTEKKPVLPDTPPALMTWGCNYDRDFVIRSSGRNFVFVGLVGDGNGNLRDNFEEAL